MGNQIREYAILEYYKVLGMLAERTASELAAELAHSLTPSADEIAIRKTRAETDDAVSVCLRKGTPPFSNLPDLRKPLAYAEKGGGLSMRQLLAVAGALNAARRVRAFLASDMPAGAGSVRGLANALAALPELEQRITSAVLSDTELADGASPALRRIRRAIEAQNDKIRSSLARFVTGKAFDGVLMDKVVTMRNGRFVVPVKQEQAARFPGIVHDRSKGGATVFVEPQIVVDMNNKLRELELEEGAEAERILAELSAAAGASALLIRENQDLLTRLDFFFAKANLALDMKAAPAEISTDGVIDIEQGRNPLIAGDKVVPVSVRFGGDERILIITGPNTGGKTVTLKTVGLFALMAQAGLHLPAARASLPVVPNVFADIGDEQSIEQSLSTFSSHMKNIAPIIGAADADSLALLDELGAGTDPTEGAALAISILEALRARGCLVMATTHYTELKKYAIQAKGVENASMEFDLATLSPTYRLNMGNPGRSNAFEIASRLGLDSAVVARARELLDAETIAFDDVMAQIELDRKEAEERLEGARRADEEARAREASGAEMLELIAQDREIVIGKAREEAERIIADAACEADAVREELKALIRDVRARGVADGVSDGKDGGAACGAAGKGSVPADAGDVLRRADQSRKRLKARQADSKRTGAAGPAQGAAARQNKTAPLCPGDIVALPGSAATGEVLTAPDDRGRVVVRSGSVKLTLAAHELEKRAEASEKKPGQGKGRYAKIVLSKMDQISPSIDLHGKNLDEAEMLVEKYLDDAVLARMHEVVINHGRGTGVLRSGIRRMLKGHKHVAKFRNGDFDEGGDGVTIVTLANR
ncbi:MAG: Smr/MutS family protein [Clostridiales Family XIII bacterium]|jgi:DNA mismatch repair protein MutS2|nr:Smr/MutS family protein [Clostridiales Family XIII bacterium]